jgi:hypothetical protein
MSCEIPHACGISHGPRVRFLSGCMAIPQIGATVRENVMYLTEYINLYWIEVAVNCVATVAQCDRYLRSRATIVQGVRPH